ncbi:MAG: glycosyltransferase [Desulfomonilaceae bacterium]
MTSRFHYDPYPRRPRILFVGLGLSTHTHAWVDLLRESQLNFRLFALPNSPPPPEWNVKTYVCDENFYAQSNPETRRFLITEKGYQEMPEPKAEFWLAEIIRRWQPHVVHTLGLDPASYFFDKVRDAFVIAQHSKWVLQLRGGSDLTLSHLDPEHAQKLALILGKCDQIISDNHENLRIGSKLGLRKDQISELCPVPGTGGIDVDSLSKSWKEPPSKRRLILWPKAYECPWSKASPVFEAIKMCWDRIQPCEIYMTGMTEPDARMWYWTLPEEIRKYCHPETRIPRDDVLRLMARARVLLAPSLVDGTPNSMFEAMACGAFPIMSPLSTIAAVARQNDNVLFARNLYPEEIAEALVRAMTDDRLVDEAAVRNLALVSSIANRAEIGPRVIAFYEGLIEDIPHVDLLNQIERLHAERDAQIADQAAQIECITQSRSCKMTAIFRKLRRLFST